MQNAKKDPNSKHSGNPAHKTNKIVTHHEHRYLMTVLATMRNENFDVSRIEIERPGITYTIDTIEELKKIKNVILKNASDANYEGILVLDANLGQNGLSQAKVFNEAIDITSVALTKLDGSAKGGIILAVAKQYNLPAKLIGIGEKIDDLIDFNKEEFIEALFEQ